MRVHFSALILSLLAVAAFPASHEVKIDALCFPAASSGPLLSYQILAPSRPPDSHPGYAAAVRHIRTALSGRGMFEAPAGVTPDLVIEIICDLSAPYVETRTRTVPLYNHSPDNLPLGAVPVGYTILARRVTVAWKYLAVSARLAGTTTPAWRAQASIADEGLDLEPALPVLAAALMNVVGRDTRGEQELRLSSKDVDVLFIQRGMKIPAR